jgi:FimV-like protein
MLSHSTTTFALLMLVQAAVTATAADFQTAISAYRRGDFAGAYREFYELAQQGHIDAQNNLGVLYQTGRGVGRDYSAAARWYRRAARHGHGDAQNNLALLYVGGYGVPQDYTIAYAWFEQAAARGVEQARVRRDRIGQLLTSAQLHQAQQMLLPESAAGHGINDATAKSFYGPVSAGETLWSIASRVKPVGVSTRVMVDALIQANPQAFSAAPPNSLKINARLRIPLQRF